MRLQRAGRKGLIVILTALAIGSLVAEVVHRSGVRERAEAVYYDLWHRLAGKHFAALADEMAGILARRADELRHVVEEAHAVFPYHAGMPAQVIAHLLAAGHPRWPLLVYAAAIALEGEDPAAAFEARFTQHRWPAAWRNGVFPFHHFHSNGHEALGIYSGEVTVQFGGDGGVTLVARPGDVIVLPAGTLHKKLASRGSLGVVGAYPAGAKPDTLRPPFSGRALKEIGRTALPAADPVFGEGGPLFQHWR